MVEINGVRDRLRVLLISGEPHPGERTWRRLLKADPSVDLVHFTILRPPEKDDLTPLNELALIAFPVRELFLDKIHEFDLIILDRFQNRGLLPLPYIANIADHVREGGALLLSVGPEFSGAASLAATPIGQVLPGDSRVHRCRGRRPVPPARDRSRPAPSGHRGARRSESAWRSRWRPGDGRSDWGSVVPAHPAVRDVHGDALLGTRDGQPLLLLDRVGKGRVALLLSDQIWLWSRGHQGGGPQAELLRRVAHWLMQEPELEENALTARVAEGRLTIERRSTDPAPPGPGRRSPIPTARPQTLNLTADQTGPGDRQPARGHAGRLAGERRRAHRLRRGRRRQSAGTGGSACHRQRCCANWSAPRVAACISLGRGNRRRLARRAGPASHRA